MANAKTEPNWKDDWKVLSFSSVLFLLLLSAIGITLDSIAPVPSKHEALSVVIFVWIVSIALSIIAESVDRIIKKF